MPSTYSVSNFRPLPSSTVMTPSLPTFSMTSAMSWPTSRSAAEIVATWAVSSFVVICLESPFSWSTTWSTALWMPFLSTIGLAPAATLRRPSLIMHWASTVAVVVPSPAMSFVLVATSLSSWAPIFSKWSSSSISLAMVTPSLVIVGAPNFLSSTTLRPFGPKVTLTAPAMASTPRFMAARASSLNTSILAGIYAFTSCRLIWLGLDDRQEVLLADDQMLLPFDLDLSAGVLAVQHTIAGQ